MTCLIKYVNCVLLLNWDFFYVHTSKLNSIFLNCVLPTVTLTVQTVRLILIIRLIVEFQSPSSMSWSSVRMRIMFGRMLRLSLWRRGFRRCVEEKWAWQSVTETNRKRRSRPAMAFDPWASPQRSTNQLLPTSCLSFWKTHTKRPPQVQNRGSNKSAWGWATGLQRSPFPAPSFYS